MTPGDDSENAHLRSHSGLHAGAALSCIPSTNDFTISSIHFRTICLERLHLPLVVTDSTCKCGQPLDQWGWHRGACPKSGRIKIRGTTIEKVVARIFRESGANVQTNRLLSDYTLDVAPGDGRRIEVFASGLNLYGGVPLAVDVTQRSALGINGEACLASSTVDGAILIEARLDKEDTYPKLLGSTRCLLLVLAMETGGRWSREAAQIIRDLAWEKAQQSPAIIRGSVFLAWQRRWVNLLAISASITFVDSLTSLDPEMSYRGDPMPCTGQLFEVAAG